MVTGLTLRLVDGLTLNGAFSVTDQGSVTEVNLLFAGSLLVLNEAALDEVLLALLLLLGLEVSGVGSVALLAVAVLALNDIIVLCLLNHDNFVNAPLSSSSNGSDVEGNVFISTTLTRSPAV